MYIKKVDNNQDCYDILSGVQVGDNVEINSFGNIKAGIISVLNKHFVQLELKVVVLLELNVIQ